MKCRHCGMELEQDEKRCPNCQMPVGKISAWQVVLLSLLGVVVTFALTVVIMKDQGVSLGKLDPATWFTKEDKTSDQTTEPATEDSLYRYDLNRESYSVSDGDAALAEKVVAKVGDIELTNADLQAYYWYSVYNFVTQYDSYLYYYGMDLTSIGLDVTQPLDQQSYMDGSMTWQRFFLEAALTDWHKYAAISEKAKQDGYEMSQEMSQNLEDMLAKAQDAWQTEGYTSLEDMVTTELGPLSSYAGYVNYVTTYHYAMDYFETQYAALEPTDAEIEAYFTEHASELDFTKDSKSHNVRHILIEPQGGTTDEVGNVYHTEEEWETCRAEAQAILDSWQSTDGTEEGFALIAKNQSADTGSSTNGGMYEELTEETNFVTEFKEWYLDESRQAGDTGLVKSDYGYHIMYYSGSQSIWQEKCKALAWQVKSDEFVKACMELWPLTLFDENIAIGEVDLT